MAVQTPTSVGTQHILGDLVYRTYVLGTVADGDTLVVQEFRIECVVINPTTSVAVGVGITPGNPGATLTFHSNATSWTGQIGVFARIR